MQNYLDELEVDVLGLKVGHRHHSVNSNLGHLTSRQSINFNNLSRELGKKMKKGKEKRRKITFKKGKKALKCIFLGYKLKKKLKFGGKKISKECG